MVEDLKVHKGGKSDRDEFAETMLRLTKEWKDQGYSDEYVLGFLDLWVQLYTVPYPVVMGYVEH